MLGYHKRTEFALAVGTAADPEPGHIPLGQEPRKQHKISDLHT
jgi:hypothetical protein